MHSPAVLVPAALAFGWWSHDRRSLLTGNRARAGMDQSDAPSSDIRPHGLNAFALTSKYRDRTLLIAPRIRTVYGWLPPLGV